FLLGRGQRGALVPRAVPPRGVELTGRPRTMESAMAFTAPGAMTRGVAPATDIAPSTSAPRAAARLAEARAAAAGCAYGACRATAAAAFGGFVAAAARGRRRGRATTRRVQAPVAKAEEYLLISVVAEDGTRIPVEARPMDTVKVVKAMVELEIGVSKEDQKLLLGERQLPEDATLSEVGIDKDLELKLVVIKAADIVESEAEASLNPMERAAPAAVGWPFPRGAWLDAALNGELVPGLPLAAGARVLARVKDDYGAPQGVEMLEVEVAYQADAFGRYFKGRHVGASDPYYSWYAASCGQRGARSLATVFRLCKCSADECGAVAPVGAVVEHLDVWQVVDPRDVAREQAKLICPAADPGALVMTDAPAAEPLPGELGGWPLGDGGNEDEEEPRGPPRKRAHEVEGTPTPGGPGEASPLDQEIAGLEETAEDPELEARLARLGGRAARGVPRQGTPKNAARPAGAVGERLAQVVAGRAAAAAPARTGAAGSRSRLASALTAALLGRDDDDAEDGAESDTERLGGRDRYQGVGIKRDLFRRIARQRPGALLENGLGHLRSQFTQQLSAGEADPLAPCVTQFLNTVFFVAHPPRTLGTDEVRVLRTLGLALDGILRGEVVETADLLMQEFKARTMAIRDGNWRSARWLTLVAQEQLPSGASLDEENAAEKVEARELKVAELRQRLADRRTSRSPTRSVQLLSDSEGDLDAAAAARVPPADAAAGRSFAQHKAAHPRREGETQDGLGSGVRADAAKAAAPSTPLPALRPPERQLRGSSQARRWRQMLAEVGTGVSSKFRLALAVHEAVHGSPGAIGRYVRKMCTSPDPTASFARLREVLPLPLPDAPLFERCRAAWYLHQQLPETCEVDATTAQGWAQLVVFSLNYQYTGHMRCPTVAARRPTASQISALGIVQEACEYFVQDAATSFELPDWDQVIASRTVSYGGEETSRALPLSLAGIMPGLPARGVAASVKAVDIADAQVGAWLADPTLALLPRDEWPAEVPRAAIQVTSKQEWYSIGTKLVELGLAAPIADDRIFKVGNRKVLAGAFGVAKGGTPSPGQACVQRLIINMVPANSYQRIMRDDIGTLSASPSWVAIPLPEGHMLLWSSDDQASAFYCYELPEAWQPYMTLAEAIPNELIGVPGPGKTHLALRVIPMGWIYAVTVLQHCHRRLGFGSRPLAAGFPADLEWRKDRPLPFKSKELEQQWIQYNIDDWDHGEVVPNAMVAELLGTMSCAQEEQRAAYDRSGISVAPGKAKHRALVLERMGAGLDGAVGRVGVTCVRAAEFRRPFMGFLNSVWAAGRWTRPQTVPLGMCDELLGFAMALPLAYTDLRARIDTCVIATDASERAGGICHTAGLSAQGVACARGGASAVTLRPGAVAAPVRGVRWRPRIVLIELFAGAAGAAVAASRLPIDVMAHVSCEVEPAARRLVRRRWAGVIELGNIEAVDAARFTEMLKGYARDADWVVLTAGSPCQDLASINVVGTGLEGSRSRLFFRVPELIQAAEAAFPKRTMWFVENVFSMTLESRAEFTRALGVTPVFLDARCLTHVRRPRLYWCSWPVTAFLASDATVETKGVGEAAYFKVSLAVERLPLSASLLEGWSTLDPEADLPCFTRPIPRRHPPFRPVGLNRASVLAAERWAADSYRYQVNNYEDGSLIWDARRERGRLPVPEERAALMGFDRLYFQAAVIDSAPAAERDSVIESLIGNTFCVQAVMYLLGSWLAQVGALAAAIPGSSCLAVGTCEANWNVVPDFQQPGHPDPQLERSLIVEFLRVADRGGTDVRLDTGAPYRARAWPRAALRTHLWAWRIAKGFRWQRPGHISALELEAAVAGARWRCRAVENHRCRYLHILDAQAIAAVSTKGRSSARALQPALRRLNSLLLATAGYPLYGYCDADDMPADTPSRWSFGRRCHAPSAAAGEGQVSQVTAQAMVRRAAARSQPPREAMVTPLTLQRYRAAVDDVVDFWIQEHRQPQTPAQVDAGVAAFIESRWLSGGSLFEINNAIAGITHAFPPVRGHLRDSWRLAKTWQRLEPAGRALPIGPLIAAAFAGAFAAVGQLGAAAVLAAGYDAFLRTGEMTSLVWSDVQLYPLRQMAVLQLRNTKSQHQTGAREFVLVRSGVAVALLARAKAQAHKQDLCLGMEPSSFMSTFGRVRELLELQDAKLTLYSWRRGGASADFRSHGSMEQTLLRGRWASARTARWYVQDAVAEATQLNLSPTQRRRCGLLASRLRAEAR
ncbi:unnamed protein product, partial [Prorocentrum cordatum]